MNHEKINMGSYNLHFIKTKNFKTVTISINFRRPVIKEEITIRKFLFSALCYSTKEFSTRRLMEIEQENLYLLNLAYGTQIFGNYINSFIDIKALNDEYTEPGNLNKSIDFLFSTLFNPNVSNGLFDKTTYEVIKNRIETDIKSIKDNTDNYSVIKVLEEMDKDNPTSFHTWGYIDDFNNIKNEDLYKLYLDILRSDIIDVFVVGDFDSKSVLDMFKEKFIVNTIKRKKTDVFITYDSYRKKTKKTLIEEKLLQQSKLSIACKILNITPFERKYVFPLYSHILGGNAYSRLFKNVREKNSLAYTISAFNKSPCSTMIIRSGIEKENYNKTLKIIKNELNKMTKVIEDKELENAKNDMLTSIETIYDNPVDIIYYYFGMEVFKSDNIEEKKKKFMSVTKEDILKFAVKVKIDTLVLLYGGSSDEENTNKEN